MTIKSVTWEGYVEPTTTDREPPPDTNPAPGVPAVQMTLNDQIVALRREVAMLRRELEIFHRRLI